LSRRILWGEQRLVEVDDFPSFVAFFLEAIPGATAELLKSAPASGGFAFLSFLHQNLGTKEGHRKEGISTSNI
jgi:hypothetical protein